MNGLSFVSAPRVSADSFARVLVRAGSPAASDAANLYAIIVSYHLDPAIALALAKYAATVTLATGQPCVQL
jgi:hypothetical protein